MTKAIELAKTPFQRLFEAAMTATEDPYRVVEMVIPMRDGVELAADVYLPLKEQLPAPAIVQSTPYDKQNQFLFPEEARFFQHNGYVVVIHDVRGRGKSEGEWRALVNDGRDGYDVIEWVAAQDWCSGKVGTTGLSYMGWTQWALAAERPPHLTCMLSTSAAGRWQQEIPYTSGCFQLYFAWWVYAVRRRVSALGNLNAVDWNEVLSRLPLEAIGDFINPTGLTWRDIMDHDTLDDFWQALRFDDRYHEIDVPCLHVSGWYDLEDLLGAFHHYEHMSEASPAADHQRLIVGPWSHIKARFPDSNCGGVEFGAEAAIDMDAEHLRWFDYWLKGERNGALDTAPARLFETGKNVWVDSPRWPVDGREEHLYLHFDGEVGRLSALTPGETEPVRSYRYDPLDPAPTQMNVERYPFEDVPLNQDPVEARPDVLVYTSEPLATEVAISGWMHLELFAESDRDDTEWHVKVADVTPEGASIQVGRGELRASYRDSLSHPTPIEPGRPYRFDVELWPAQHAFQPGHRIRVTVTSSDFPWFARTLNQFGPIKDQVEPLVATNTIHHALQRASRLRLPVIRGSVAAL